MPSDFANEIRVRKTLAPLVVGITLENFHGEWGTGPDVGKEVVGL